MSSRTVHVTRKVFARAGICLLGTAALMLPPATAAGAEPGFNPVVIRGTSVGPAVSQLPLVYVATFPKGSFDPQLDKLSFGAMFPSDPLIPDSNPTVSAGSGDILLSVHRPLGLSPDQIPSESIFTPVSFGPGSKFRIKATFIAPVGPYATTGGFAIGLGARTGGKDDLPGETRVFATVNVRPNQLVRFQLPFGSDDERHIVL